MMVCFVYEGWNRIVYVRYVRFIDLVVKLNNFVGCWLFCCGLVECKFYLDWVEKFEYLWLDGFWFVIVVV